MIEWSATIAWRNAKMECFLVALSMMHGTIFADVCYHPAGHGE
jgi:hypothetical protein